MSQQYVTDKKGRPFSVTASIVLTVITVGYMLPWMIATMRGKSNHWAVMVLNLLLGWTIVGWVVALVMAVNSHNVVGSAPMMQQFPPPPRR